MFKKGCPKWLFSDHKTPEKSFISGFFAHDFQTWEVFEGSEKGTNIDSLKWDPIPNRCKN